MTPEQFAIEATKKLQAAGYQALFAGGCVRDALLGREPKDYDVATSALPDQVRDLFGHKRTIAIGAAFGVITVIGPKSAGQIEIATFRRDGGYADGRHPDSIEFTDAREDAMRRDFTINGMFFDPVTDEVIDYVGGQEDLKRQRIRAIGDPHERIGEDKLRMLRAVRFAATYEFELESETLAAVQLRAGEIHVVSPERIGKELRRMLGSPGSSVALGLLFDSGLWSELFPDNAVNRFRAIDVLRGLDPVRFESAVAAILMIEDEGRIDAGRVDERAAGGERAADSRVDQLKERWRLTNSEAGSIKWMIANVAPLQAAHALPWPDVQPLLIHADVRGALAAVDAIAGKDCEGTAFCRERLAWPEEQLNPDPLLNGTDLFDIGVTPGPDFKRVLDQVRREQLDGRVNSREEALAKAREIA